ncbi:MAG TPA: hypothetical protein VI112_13905 [Bacteroidia bacterium]|jgi:hypothetical protein
MEEDEIKKERHLSVPLTYFFFFLEDFFLAAFFLVAFFAFLAMVFGF